MDNYTRVLIGNRNGWEQEFSYQNAQVINNDNIKFSLFRLSDVHYAIMKERDNNMIYIHYHKGHAEKPDIHGEIITSKIEEFLKVFDDPSVTSSTTIYTKDYNSIASVKTLNKKEVIHTIDKDNFYDLNLTTLGILAKHYTSILNINHRYSRHYYLIYMDGGVCKLSVPIGFISLLLSALRTKLMNRTIDILLPDNNSFITETFLWLLIIKYLRTMFPADVLEYILASIKDSPTQREIIIEKALDSIKVNYQAIHNIDRLQVAVSDMISLVQGTKVEGSDKIPVFVSIPGVTISEAIKDISKFVQIIGNFSKHLSNSHEYILIELDDATELPAGKESIVTMGINPQKFLTVVKKSTDSEVLGKVHQFFNTLFANNHIEVTTITERS